MSPEQLKKIKKKLSELKEIPEGFQFDPERTWKKLDLRLSSESHEPGRNWWETIVNSFSRVLRELSKLFVPQGKKRPMKNRRRKRRRMHPKGWGPFSIRQNKN